MRCYTFCDMRLQGRQIICKSHGNRNGPVLLSLAIMDGKGLSKNKLDDVALRFYPKIVFRTEATRTAHVSLLQAR